MLHWNEPCEISLLFRFMDDCSFFSVYILVSHRTNRGHFNESMRFQQKKTMLCSVWMKALHFRKLKKERNDQVCGTGKKERKYFLRSWARCDALIPEAECVRAEATCISWHRVVCAVKFILQFRTAYAMQRLRM